MGPLIQPAVLLKSLGYLTLLRLLLVEVVARSDTGQNIDMSIAAIATHANQKIESKCTFKAANINIPAKTDRIPDVR